MTSSRNIYMGTFLIALATLILEITLARLMSVITWYHLAFFAISTAMLGMTAGSVTVYLKPDWFRMDRLNQAISKACIYFALSIPLSLILLCIIPLELRVTSMVLFAFLIVTGACSAPFYFAGMAISAILTKQNLPIGKLYAVDLIGAALGCLFVLVGLEFFDAPSLILLCAPIGILSSLAFTWRNNSPNGTRTKIILFVALLGLALLNNTTNRGIRPFVVKGRIEETGKILYEKWNSFSRVTIYKGNLHQPHMWGPSDKAPKEKIFQYGMVIDGAASTTLRGYKTLKDIEHLKYDVTNVAHFIRPTGNAAVIGVGGGRDMQSALYFGHKKVTGVEINPVFINLLKGRFREFAGIADKPGVTLVVDEARSYLSRTDECFSVIMMSLIDTWASTGAGAFTLSENALYTVEAWEVFLGRLKDDGVFTVSRWYNPKRLGETGRILSLGMATLFKIGVEKPNEHIAMITSGRISTLLFSKKPFTKSDIERLQKISDELFYNFAIIPGIIPSDTELANILSTNSRSELEIAVRDRPLNFSPPTDENPYFFNMLKLNNLRLGLNKGGGATKGNLLATLTLLVLIFCLLILAIITIILPLFIGSKRVHILKGTSTIIWSGVVYFSLIGAGFMFIEISLIQRLSVFLGHPVYALGILLFTIILGAGMGSLLSDKLPLTRRPWMFILPVVMVAGIFITKELLLYVMGQMITSSMINKSAVSVMLLFPLGIIMGQFFPTGLKLIKKISDVDMPWYWALNGVFGVLTSALAVFISIYFGISVNFYMGALCYSIIVFLLYSMERRGNDKLTGGETARSS